MSTQDDQPVVLSPPLLGSARDGVSADGDRRTLWSLVDDRLRGRWKRTVVLGLVLGGLFGGAGYLSTAPMYQSIGFIRIAPKISPVLRETTETGLMPLYHNFVQTQARLIGSRRVLERALADETLSSLPWAQHPDALGRLENGLTVQSDRSSELITVQFGANSAPVAQAAVDAVIKAYDELYGSVGGDEIGSKFQTLRGRRALLRQQLAGQRRQIQEYVSSSEYGAVQFAQLLGAKMARMEAVDHEIQELEQVLELAAPGASPAQTDAASLARPWMRDASARLEQLRRTAERYRAQVQQISVDQRRLEELQAEADYIEQDLAEIDSRIKYLEIEAESVRTGRISIAAYGDRPLAPSHDRRRKLAAVGAIGGLGLSFGLFFLLGTIDRRAYGSAQLRDPDDGYRCIGVLPDLGPGRLDRESCAVAEQCVHQIRNRIEAIRKPNSSFVFAVTSPYQGDGKTSIVMALGWSYAAAGNRTILVDCDMVGRHLTQQMGMADRAGLKEVLREGQPNGQVALGTGPNLSVLPAGADSGFGPEVIRRGDLEAVFRQLRQEFDVIIVDTGPMLASLEGLPVVLAADGVLLALRRGRRRSRLDECIDYLRTVRASCLGVVLNWSVRSDCDRYVSKSSLAASYAEGRHGDSDRGAAALAGTAHAAEQRNPLILAMEAGSRHLTPDE